MLEELSRHDRVKRWKNAKDWAKRINKALDLGYLVVDYDNKLITKPMTINNREIYIRNGNSTRYFFVNDPDRDEGLYETMESWLERHKVKFYSPVEVILK